MGFKRAIIVMAILALAISWGSFRAQKSAAAPPSQKEELIGTWRLDSRVVRHPDGTSYPDPQYGPESPIGYIMYDNTGHMAVQFMGLHRPNNHSSLAYDAYFGTYSVDEKANPPTVTHHIEGSLNPGSVGHENVRDLLLTGDKMMLVVHTSTPDLNSNTFSRVK
jgi:hypothetical protein